MRMARVALVIMAVASLAFAQADKSKRPSPPGTAEVTLKGKSVKIDYSRPKMADPKTGQKRQIMGTVVPYGQPWRLGANEATALTTETDLDIGGKTLPAGKYTLYALPEADKWTLIISKKTGQWGIPYPGEAEDFARLPMKVEKSAEVIDPFTIAFQPHGPDQADLSFGWENTKASVAVKAK